MDKAIKIHQEELEWRINAENAVGPQLKEYEKQMRGTIGIRQQERLSRDQALYVASCNSHHRDLSLKF